ncbi:hypothetical protein K1X76_05855 [bacterium]|nr:hypothetical protein [bacterium]
MLKKFILLSFVFGTFISSTTHSMEIHPSFSLFSASQFGNNDNMGKYAPGLGVEAYVRLFRFFGTGGEFVYNFGRDDRKLGQLNLLAGLHLLDPDNEKLDVYVKAGIGDAFYTGQNSIVAIGRLGTDYWFMQKLGVTASAGVTSVLKFKNSDDSFSLGQLNAGVRFRFD